MKRLLPLILFLFPLVARSQSSFLIPVQTTTGQGISGATVTLTCTDTTNGCVGKGPFSATSTNGNASFTAIPSGNYTVAITGPNLTTFSYAYTVPLQANGGTLNPSNLNNIIYVDGVTYPTIQAAETAVENKGGGIVVVPPGIYSSSGTTLTIAHSNIVIQCSGFDTATIRSTSASLPTITLAANITGVQIKDCTIDHSPAAGLGSGAVGIATPTNNFANYDTFSGLHIQFNDVGLSLGPAAIGWVRNNVIEKNAGDGIFLSNNGTGGMQWELDNNLSQKNGGAGYHVTTLGTSASTLEAWNQDYSFANSSYGAVFNCISTNPCNDIRIVNGFFGQDGNSEIYLDTFGGHHQITATQIELAGTAATGPNVNTPASNTGDGVTLTANNTDVNLSAMRIGQNSFSGINSSASHLVVSGVETLENGAAGVSAALKQSGIYIGGGTTVSISGGKSGNITLTQQKYGIYTTVDALTVAGTRVDNNATQAIASTVTLNLSRFFTGDAADTFVAGNIVPSAWTTTGSTTITAVAGTKEHFHFTVNTGTGAGNLNPTLAITYPVPWASTPYYVCKNTNTTGASVFTVTGENGATTTAMTLTVQGTPTISVVYTFSCVSP